MRDLPPDENFGHHQRWRWMNRGMLALVLSAAFLGLVLVIYFVLLPPVHTPVTKPGLAGRHPEKSKRHVSTPSVDPVLPDRVGATAVVAGELTAAPGTAATTPAAVPPDAPVDSPAPVGPQAPVGSHAPVTFLGRSISSEAVRIDFIVASVVQSPRYELSGGARKPFRPGSWLQVDVDFTTFPSVISELTLRYLITLRGETFSGDIRHADLEAGAHRSVAYLIPRRTERYLVDGKLPARTLDAVLIQAFIRNEVVGSGSIGQGLATSRNPTEGFIRSLSQTPFFPLAGDRYEPVAPPAPVKTKEKRVPASEPATRFTQTLTSRE